VIRSSTITLWHIRCRERASSTSSIAPVRRAAFGSNQREVDIAMFGSRAFAGTTV
jgi:hypothetical protein